MGIISDFNGRNLLSDQILKKHISVEESKMEDCPDIQMNESHSVDLPTLPVGTKIKKHQTLSQERI